MSQPNNFREERNGTDTIVALVAETGTRIAVGDSFTMANNQVPPQLGSLHFEMRRLGINGFRIDGIGERGSDCHRLLLWDPANNKWLDTALAAIILIRAIEDGSVLKSN